MKPMITALAAAVSLAGAPAYSETFVLVHGAFQTAEGWDSVVAALEARGHSAVAVNLPGRASDGRALGEVTMADHVAAVSEAVTGAATGATGEGEVVLVGHSFGGMVILAVAEAAPERIASLVYVAAYLPRSGQSMQDLAASDHHNGFVEGSFVVAPDYSHATLNPDHRVAIFAADAPADMANAIAAAMVDEPLQPVATPVELTEARFGGVRKAYVATLADNAVSLNLQLTMNGRGTVDEVIPIPTGHAPHQVAPEALVDALIAAATPDFE